MANKLAFFFILFYTYFDGFSQVGVKTIFFDNEAKTDVRIAVISGHTGGGVLFVATQSRLELSLDTIENNLDSLITISADGYDNFTITLRDFIIKDTIFLNRNVRLLEEVVVRYTSPNDISYQLWDHFNKKFSKHQFLNIQIADYHRAKIDKFVGLFNGYIKQNSAKGELDKIEIKEISSISSHNESSVFRIGFFKILIEGVLFHKTGLFNKLRYQELSWNWSPRAGIAGQEEIFSVIETTEGRDSIFIAFDVAKNELISISDIYNRKDSSYFVAKKINFFGGNIPFLLSEISHRIYSDNEVYDTCYVLFSVFNQKQNSNPVFDIGNRGRYLLEYQKKIQDSTLNGLFDTLLKVNEGINSGKVIVRKDFINTYANYKNDKYINLVFSKNKEIDFGSMYRLKCSDRDFETIYNGKQVCISKGDILSVYDYSKVGLKSISYRDLFEPVTRAQYFFYTFRNLYNNNYNLTDTTIEGKTVKKLFFESKGLYKDFKTYITLFYDSIDYIIVGLKERQDLENGKYWEQFIWTLEAQYNNPEFTKLFSTNSVANGLKIKFKKPNLKDKRRYKYTKFLEKKIIGKPNSRDKSDFDILIHNNTIDTFTLNQFFYDTDFIGKITKSENYKLNAYFFWFNSCFYCKKLYPLLQNMNEEFRGRIQVIGVNSEDKIEEFVENGWKPMIEFSGTYFDADDIAQLLSVAAYPTLIITEPGGKIIYRAEGYEEINRSLFRTLKRYFSKND